MSQFNKHFNPIKPLIRTNKNFVYQGKKYPIDFSLVKKYSNYFYKNKDLFKSVEDIEIIPDKYTLLEESIPIFIACCQKEPFDINDTNIFSLYQLSVQYEVPTLNQITSQYIAEHQKPLVFQTIFYKLRNQNTNANFDLSPEEEIISSNFFEYINDEQLLSLPVPVLYHIISNDHLAFKSMNTSNQTQFIDFLFRCLDKHRREASVLFLTLDLENERVDLLSHLISRYSDFFDFNMINAKFLAKNTAHLLSELQRLKIEFTEKLNEMKTENENQKKSFKSSQKKLNDSNNDLINSNNELMNSNKELVKRLEKLENELSAQKMKLETQNNKMIQMEERLNEQESKIERYTNLKVNEIKINTEPKFLLPGSTMTLSAFVKPRLAFNDGVNWQIVEEVERSVEVRSKNEKSLVLKGLIEGKKITVIAKALDGSRVTATKEIIISALNVKIEVNVDQNQTIKGTIKTTEIGGIALDKSKSKFMLDTNNSRELGNSAYQNGFQLDDLNKNISFKNQPGNYYLHILAVDNCGSSRELVSNVLKIEQIKPMCYTSTGGVQSVQLEPGSYKLEAWGAQGGSFNSTYHGGFGGYSTGIINLKSKTTLYIVVGKSTSTASGGYNGGGSGGVYNGDYVFTSYGGGGATHIGLKSGELKSFANDYSDNLLIVAGGGGGATDGSKYPSGDKKCWCGIGGCGGGCVGGEGVFEPGKNRYGKGGTQSSGGKNDYMKGHFDECGMFGQGANCVRPSGHPGAGGGGGFYGGGSGGNSGPGGGGSGYINTSKLTDACMFGYKTRASSSTESKTVSITNAYLEATSNYAKQGDGYVKITVV